MRKLQKLSKVSLGGLASKGIQIPKFDIGSVQKRVLHLGFNQDPGAKQILYFDDYLTIDSDWAICGASIESKTNSSMLQWKVQDCLYTVINRKTGAAPRCRVVGAVRDFINREFQQKGILEGLAHPEMKMLLLSQTQGAGLHVADGNLDVSSPEIQHDLKNIHNPMTLEGYLIHGFLMKKKEHLKPFTTIILDNFYNNGVELKKWVLQMAHEIDPELEKWIEGEASFPNSFVDRVVYEKEEEKSFIERKYGVIDEFAISTENYMRWVLEDNFCNEKPDLSKVGVLVTNDVTPYYRMKTQLMDGSLTCLCFFSSMMGFRTAREAIDNKQISALLQRYFKETLNTLTRFEGYKVESYPEVVLERFNSSEKSYLMSFIGRTGLERIKQFILEPMKLQLSRRLDSEAGVLCIASWIAFTSGRWTKESSDDHKASDAEKELQVMAKAVIESENCDPIDIIRNKLDKQLAEDGEFVERVRKHLVYFKKNGVAATLAEALAQPVSSHV